MKTARTIGRCGGAGLGVPALQLIILCCACAAAVLARADVQAQAPSRRPVTVAAGASFKTPLTLDQTKNKQAVLDTSAGTIVIQLLPEAAPNHVGYFIKLAREGAYNGTVFHRAVKLGIIQGGDPLSKDPAKRALYGSGGLGVLKAEPNPETHTRGAVSAVLQPGKPDSAGSQFFICIAEQPTLDGQYTVFGRVVEGLDIAETISQGATDAEGRLNDRVEIKSVTIRDTPPPEAVPFATETPQELARWHAVLETTMGAITVEFLPDKAPEHVRNFLRLSKLGAYDGTNFHRVVPNFVIQAGAMNSRRGKPTEKQQKAIGTLQPEFNDTLHVKGVLSMARGADPASASTSFFICTGPAASLDGKYTAFGRVIDGMPVVDAIEKTPLNGEEPTTRVEITHVRLEQQP
jgi:peptidyl-prolyl cis-trans isomerase B (cyclophilin B)